MASNTGKSIRVYLPDGSVSGIRYAELVNWTGQAISCPRSRLAELREAWPEASKPGVYFLFENRFGDVKPLAYVGESENVASRLLTHDRAKEFWNDVVIFTSKDENLTKSHVKYLESVFVVKAKKADRYSLENGNLPPESSLPRADRDAMDEFAANAQMVLGVLGHSILEPLLKRGIGGTATQATLSVTAEAVTPRNDGADLIFTVNELRAVGRVTDEGFVLKAGSQISKKVTDSIPGRVAQIRTSLIANGKLSDGGAAWVAEEDILLSSSSYAAALVAGTSRSGPQSWRLVTGGTLKQQEDVAFTSISQNRAPLGEGI